MWPKQTTSALASSAIKVINSQLVSGVGFSKGCPALALKKPPPLVPRCLTVGEIAADRDAEQKDDQQDQPNLQPDLRDH